MHVNEMNSRTTAPENLPRVCVIILNYNSYEETIEYVDILRRQQDIALHILIVDNCSPNGAFDVINARFPDAADVTVLKSERNGGYAYGNNYGLRSIENDHYDYVLISNNDIKIEDPRLISKLIHHYRQLEAPAFISGLAHSGGVPAKYPAWKMPQFIDDVVGSLRCTNFFFRARIAYELSGKDNVLPVDCLPGCFFLAAKEIFFRVGLMDENTFLYMEEVILADKVKSLGLKNYLVKDLAYEHAESKTISSIFSQEKMHSHLMQSRLYYYSRYRRAGGLKAGVLRFLSWLWKIENRLYCIFKTRGI